MTTNTIFFNTTRSLTTIVTIVHVFTLSHSIISHIQTIRLCTALFFLSSSSIAISSSPSRSTTKSFGPSFNRVIRKFKTTGAAPPFPHTSNHVLHISPTLRRPRTPPHNLVLPPSLPIRTPLPLHPTRRSPAYFRLLLCYQQCHHQHL